MAHTRATASSISATPPLKRSALGMGLRANWKTAMTPLCALSHSHSLMRRTTRFARCRRSRMRTRHLPRPALRWSEPLALLLLVQTPAKRLRLVALTLKSLGTKCALAVTCLIRSRLRYGALRIRRITAIACSLLSISVATQTRRAQLLEPSLESFTVLRESQKNGSTP